MADDQMFSGPCLAVIPERGWLHLAGARWQASVRLAGSDGNLATVRYATKAAIVGAGDVIGCYRVALAFDGRLAVVVPGVCCQGATAPGCPKEPSRRPELAEHVNACYRLTLQTPGWEWPGMLETFLPNSYGRLKELFESTPPQTLADLVRPLGGLRNLTRQGRNTTRSIHVRGCGLTCTVGGVTMPIPVHDRPLYGVRVDNGMILAARGLTIQRAPLVVAGDETALATIARVRRQTTPLHLWPSPAINYFCDDRGAPVAAGDIVARTMDVGACAYIRATQAPTRYVPGIPYRAPGTAMTKLSPWLVNTPKFKTIEYAQVKYDGQHVQIHVLGDGRATIYTKECNDVTTILGPQLAAACSSFAYRAGGLTSVLVSCILDGEYVRETHRDADGRPARTYHNAGRGVGTARLVVYDSPYVSHPLTSHYMERLKQVRAAVSADSGIFVPTTIKLDPDDKQGQIRRFLKAYCIDRRYEGIILRPNNTFRNDANRRNHCYAIKTSYLRTDQWRATVGLGDAVAWEEFHLLRVKWMGSFAPMHTSNLYYKAKVDHTRHVFGIADPDSRYPADHPWRGYVPLFTHAYYISSAVKAAVHAAPCVAAAEVRTAGVGPEAQVTRMGIAEQSPTFLFRADSYAELKGKQPDWAPIRCYPVVPGVGEVGNGPTTTWQALRYRWPFRDPSRRFAPSPGDRVLAKFSDWDEGRYQGTVAAVADRTATVDFVISKKELTRQESTRMVRKLALWAKHENGSFSVAYDEAKWNDPDTVPSTDCMALITPR